MKEIVHYRLILDVSVELHGNSAMDIQQRMEDIPKYAMGEGMITGDSPSTVDEYSSRVVKLKRKPRNKRR